jgi:hypothetical protein
MTAEDWTLWGFHPAYTDVPIKLVIGDRRTCGSGQRFRERCGGWTLAIYRHGVPPTGLRAIVASQAAPSRPTGTSDPP